MLFIWGKTYIDQAKQLDIVFAHLCGPQIVSIWILKKRHGGTWFLANGGATNSWCGENLLP